MSKFLKSYGKKSWVVFAKKTLWESKISGGISGKVTFKIAISNHRIKAVDDKM